MKYYRATMDFCLAAESIRGAAEAQDQLIEAAETLGLFFQFGSTVEMQADEIEPESALAVALSHPSARPALERMR